MGRPKALLPWRRTTLVEHVEGVLRGAGVTTTYVVTSAELELPERLAAQVVVDSEVGRGPLAAIRDGLRAAHDGARAERALVVSVDLPFLSKAFIESLSRVRLEGSPSRAPVEGEYPQPLAAIYETRLGDAAAELLDSGKQRPLHLLEAANAELIPIEDLDDASALRNCNTPDRYLEALRDDEQQDEWELEFLGLSAIRRGHESSVRSQPSSLGDALRQIDDASEESLWTEVDTLRPEYLAALNGQIIGRNLDIPIGPGERVTIFDAAVGG